jgi:hypothetical protein
MDVFMCQSHACENAVDPQELRVKGGISLSLSYLTNGHYLTYLAHFLTLRSSGWKVEFLMCSKDPN